MAGKLFIISAPSGAGKTTLIQALIDRYGLNYDLERVVTYTSKKPRPSEQHGTDYYFVSLQEFQAKIEQGFFLEWSGAYEAYYGSPRHLIDQLARGKSFLLIIDRVGAELALKAHPDAIPIWIYTHTINKLRERLVARNTESLEQIERRLERARTEIFEEISIPLYKYHVLNHDFEIALERLFTIIKRELF